MLDFSMAFSLSLSLSLSPEDKGYSQAKNPPRPQVRKKN
jgi:hypothetical protein